MKSSHIIHALGTVLGCLISTSAINLFLMTNHLLSGGLTGIGIIIYYLTGLPVGIQVLIYNVPLFIWAYKVMGKEYIASTIFGTVMFSVCVDVTQFLRDYQPVDDPMLAAIFGGVFVGTGYGIVFRSNGTTGGLDIASAIIKKYYSINMGMMNFMFNCVIMAASMFIFGPKPAMYTLICMFVSATLTDKVVAGFITRKAVLIVSEQSAMISEGIIHEMGRGVTFLHAEGAFLHRAERVIFVVVTLTQIAKLKSIAYRYDPAAFMIVVDANEVMGRGFTMPLVKIEEMVRKRDEEMKSKTGK
ncbi:MAG: YitT family protein [Selenomonadaceae bacterium]